MHVIKPTIKAY